MSERSPETRDRQRLDAWLWHARVVRTRSLARALACDGYVRVNGTRAEQPAKPVRVGDVLTIALERRVRVLEIRALGERRGNAAEAGLLFAELLADRPASPATAAIGATAP